MNRGAVSSHYNVIVLGGGAPGGHCAAALADSALPVAVAERSLVGGAYWACIPSKTLLPPGEAVHGARDAAGLAEADVKAALACVTSWPLTIPTPDRSAGWQARALSSCRHLPTRGTRRRRPAEMAALAVGIMTATAMTGAPHDIDGGEQLVA